MSLVDDGPKRRKIVTFGEVNVDRDARSVIKKGDEVYLRPKEFDLLVYLLERPGAVCTRRQIMDAVWGEDCPSGEKAVDVTMRTLREKVEDNPSRPRYLVTIRHAGYKFEF
jgi:DNA-binding response OmpR family regulator